MVGNESDQEIYDLVNDVVDTVGKSSSRNGKVVAVRVTYYDQSSHRRLKIFWVTYIEPTLELRFSFVSPMNTRPTIHPPVSFSLRSRPT